MALSRDEKAIFDRLAASLQRSQAELTRLDQYYEGLHRLERLGLAVPPELERFVTVVNWPRVTADSVDHRSDLEGFRLRDADGADDELWDVWQANDLDEESQQAHLESLIFGRSYVCVGSRDPNGDVDPSRSDDDIPLVTVESPFEVSHEIDPRSRQVRGALRRSDNTSIDGTATTRLATLYLPHATVWLEQQGARGWVETDRDPHAVGWAMIVPLLNRPRLRQTETPGVRRATGGRLGTSELADVISLTDAAARALTNAQVATEVLAVPQRYVVGAQPKDFVDQNGQPLPAWETYFGAVWALANDKATVGQFNAADLTNFEKIVSHYANLASGVSGLPARFYGQITANPPSEGSIVADETRLIMNARRKHRGWGGSWERAMRLVRRVMDGKWNPDLQRMESLWRDPETPTRAQTADAVVKLYTAKDGQGRPLLPREAAWEELGYSATRRRQLREMVETEDAAAAQADPIARAAEAFRTPPPGAETTPDSATPAADPAPRTNGAALPAAVQ